MNLDAIFTTVGISAVGIGALTFLLKSLWKQMLSRDLVKYRADLQDEHDRDVERLKNDLRTVAFEHETRFAKAHARRAEVIAELYKLLYETEKDFRSLAAIFELGGALPEDEKRKRAADSYDGLKKYFGKYRIYLEKAICADIDGLLKKLKRVFFQRTQGFPLKSSWEERDPELICSASKIMKEDVPPIIKKIEKSFRGILGIDDSPEEQSSKDDDNTKDDE